MSNAAHTHDSHADTTATRRVTTETKSSYETTELIAYVRDRLAVADGCQHGLIPLLRHTQLPHKGVSPITRSSRHPSPEGVEPISRRPCVTSQAK